MNIDFTLVVFFLLVMSLIARVCFFAFSRNSALAVPQTAMSLMGYCPSARTEVLPVMLPDPRLQFSCSLGWQFSGAASPPAILGPAGRHCAQCQAEESSTGTPWGSWGCLALQDLDLIMPMAAAGTQPEPHSPCQVAVMDLQKRALPAAPCSPCSDRLQGELHHCAMASKAPGVPNSCVSQGNSPTGGLEWPQPVPLVLVLAQLRTRPGLLSRVLACRNAQHGWHKVVGKAQQARGDGMGWHR